MIFKNGLGCREKEGRGNWGQETRDETAVVMWGRGHEQPSTRTCCDGGDSPGRGP